MSNQLKFYREQMAAFEGNVNPQKAIESGYYIPEPRKSSSSLLTRVALRPAAKHLFIGGIGSGKTTQLLIACQQLNEIENLKAFYVDASSFANISNLSQGSLSIIVGLFLSIQTECYKDDPLVYSYHDYIRKQAYGEYVEESDNDFDHDYHPEIFFRKGILEKPISDTGDENYLIKAIVYLRNLIGNEIILCIDGLDRIDDAKLFAQIVATDVQQISLTGIGVVLVGPLMFAYSQYRESVEAAVNYTSYQTCFDPEKDPEAHIFLENILITRSLKDFIQKAALKSLVDYSGGVLRDLINLTQSSIEEAYIFDEENLKQSHVEAAVDSFGRAKLLGVSDQDLEILKQVAKTGKFFPRTDEEVRLLVTGRILEYQYPTRRFSVHPTLRSFLRPLM